MKINVTSKTKYIESLTNNNIQKNILINVIKNCHLGPELCNSRICNCKVKVPWYKHYIESSVPVNEIIDLIDENEDV